VRISVCDTGVGMDRETRRRAFEPFFTTKGPGRGSGLGLAAVLGFARQSGGSVDVESEPGRGTAVHLLLPGAAGAQVAVAAADAVEGAGAGECILVVEDEDAVRALIERTLARGGYRVRSAADGGEALELLARDAAVDLVLADVRMPRMDGLALRAALATQSPSTAVLLMSGFPGVDGRVSDGDPGVLAKPFRPSALLRAVRGALGVRKPDAGPGGPGDETGG
jgi:CheY-like chemotaxis protein